MISSIINYEDNAANLCQSNGRRRQYLYVNLKSISLRESENKVCE